MLTFKKNWIYKYNEWCKGNLFTIDNVNDSKSICPYFWKTLWNLLAVNMLYISVSHFPAVAGVWILQLETFENLEGWVAFYSFVVAGYLAIVAFIIGLLLIAVIMEICSRIKERNAGKQSSVFVEYIKAKKSKICPMIKWED